MNCKKCNMKIFEFDLCKSHFESYFKRKFKTHLRKTGLLERNETLNLIGENKQVAKFLLVDLGRKLDAKFNNNGRKIETFALDTKAVKQLSNMMIKKIKKFPTSLLECFTQIEINKFAKLNKLKTQKVKLSKFEKELHKQILILKKRRPNIEYCTKSMMDEFEQVVKK